MHLRDWQGQAGLENEELHQWNDIIGIRNRIVHDYMNIDMRIILELVRSGKYHFVAQFLMRPPGK